MWNRQGLRGVSSPGSRSCSTTPRDRTQISEFLSGLLTVRGLMPSTYPAMGLLLLLPLLLPLVQPQTLQPTEEENIWVFIVPHSHMDVGWIYTVKVGPGCHHPGLQSFLLCPVPVWVSYGVTGIREGLGLGSASAEVKLSLGCCHSPSGLEKQG